MSHTRTLKILFGSFILAALYIATFSLLVADEAYYHLYSQNLDWGYFDHPPAIALLIKCGSWLGGEIGVRLGSVILHITSLLLIGKHLIPDKKPPVLLLAMGILLSIPLWLPYSFVATPDAPLLFFSVLFLIGFQKLPERGMALLLAIAMAGMMYSKYHGILIIVLAMIAKPKVVFTKSFIIATILSLVLYFPHLYWQYSHDFPSIQYHLSDRFVTFKWKYLGEFFINWILFFNPVFLWLFFGRMKKLIRKHPFRLYYIISLGMWGFFLLATRKGHVQPQWLVLSIVPYSLIILEILKDKKYKKTVQLTFAASILLLIFIRLTLVIDFIPAPFFQKHFHNAEKWAKDIQKEANGLPVIFVGNYQATALYSFYGDRKTTSIQTLGYRQTQFDYWQKANEYNGQSVFLIAGVPFPASNPLDINHKIGGELQGGKISLFQTLNDISLEVENKEIHFDSKEILMDIEIFNPYDFDLILGKGKDIGLYAQMKDGRIIGPTSWKEDTTFVIPKKNQQTIHLSFPILDGYLDGDLGITLRDGAIHYEGK